MERSSGIIGILSIQAGNRSLGSVVIFQHVHSDLHFNKAGGVPGRRSKPLVGIASPYPHAETSTMLRYRYPEHCSLRTQHRCIALAIH